LKLTSLKLKVNVDHTDHESNSMADDMNIMIISKCNGGNCHLLLSLTTCNLLLASLVIMISYRLGDN